MVFKIVAHASCILGYGQTRHSHQSDVYVCFVAKSNVQFYIDTLKVDAQSTDSLHNQWRSKT